MSKKINVFVRLLGVVFCFTAIWLGSYVVHSLPIGHWVRFPVFVSAVFAFLAGLGMAIWGTKE